MFVLLVLLLIHLLVVVLLLHLLYLHTYTCTYTYALIDTYSYLFALLVVIVVFVILTFLRNVFFIFAIDIVVVVCLLVLSYLDMLVNMYVYIHISYCCCRCCSCLNFVVDTFKTFFANSIVLSSLSLSLSVCFRHLFLVYAPSIYEYIIYNVCICMYVDFWNSSVYTYSKVFLAQFVVATNCYLLMENVSALESLLANPTQYLKSPSSSLLFNIKIK